MKILKDSSTGPVPEISGEDLDLINRLSKKNLAPEEIFTFSAVLCDNDVDRDFERFDTPELDSLARLFVGKTGISDHEWSASRQIARIYKTRVLREPGKTTATGEDYACLKAWAYMLRTPENTPLINDIEGGIKKETSVGCSVSSSVCSICGKPSGSCEHVRGQYYGGSLCHAVLSGVTDAYEWSFVAVPAQRAAGVTKAFATTPHSPSLKAFVESDGGARFAPEFARLSALAKAGERYNAWLKNETLRLCLICDRDLYPSLSAAADALDCKQLEDLRASLEKKTARILPLTAQLPGSSDVVRFDGGDYII